MQLRQLLVLLVAVASASRPAIATDMESWIATHGSLVLGAAQTRAEECLSSIHPCAESARLRVHVIDSPDVGAFAWPEGDIVVTSALLALLDDDELAAAIAHEIGHLLSDDRFQATATLIGRPSSQDAEAAADELGVRVLSAGGRHPDAMINMLEKVRASLGPDDPTDEPIGHRLELLQKAP